MKKHIAVFALVIILLGGHFECKKKLSKSHHMKHKVNSKKAHKLSKNRVHKSFHRKLKHHKSHRSKRKLTTVIGKMTVGTLNFPKYTKLTLPSIQINTPKPNYPQIMADPKRMKPIIIQPQIIYPDIHKRVIVHHGDSFPDLFSKLTQTVNPMYMQMAALNPYYKPFTKNNWAFDNYMKSPELKSAVKTAKSKLKKHWFMEPLNTKMPSFRII